jgi:hypothetical protein
MNMKFAKTAVAVLLAGLPFSAGASQLSGWVKTVNARIERVMPADGISGSIKVSFHRGPDGRAAGVSFVDGDRRLTSCAERTLAGLGILPALPAGYDPATPIVMQLIMGADGSYDLAAANKAMLAVRKAHAEANARNAEVAARHEGSDQLALANPR